VWASVEMHDFTPCSSPSPMVTFKARRSGEAWHSLTTPCCAARFQNSLHVEAYESRRETRARWGDRQFVCTDFQSQQRISSVIRAFEIHVGVNRNPHHKSVPDLIVRSSFRLQNIYFDAKPGRAPQPRPHWPRLSS